MIPIETAPWMDDARCKKMSPDFFHPGPKNVAAQEAAMAVCCRCPVKAPCLARAMQLGTEALGVWGGTTEADRRRLRGKRSA